MGRSTHIAAYGFNPLVSWTIELDGVFIIRSDSPEILFLSYPEAALWDILSRGTEFDAAVKMITAIAKMKSHEAEAWISSTVADWERSGWLMKR